MVGKTVDYEMLKEYETAAEKARHDCSVPYEQRAENVEKLLSEFLKKAVAAA